MKLLLHSPAVYIEIGQRSLKALHGEAGLEVPLERLPNGRLTETCKETLIAGFRSFLNRKDWQPRARAYCAIGARGVSLRKLTLPSAAGDELQRMLRMQIESEFPLAPDELAWGYRALGQTRQNGATKQDVLVIAVKKEVVEEYSQILARCGLHPVFTAAALARGGICPQPAGTWAILDIGRNQSELALFEAGVPVSVRVLPWGEDAIKSGGEKLDSLAGNFNGSLAGRKVFVCGTDFSAQLSARFGADFESLRIPAGEGRSAAVLGLKKSVEDAGAPLVLFQTEQANGKAALTRPAPLKLAAYAVALALGVLLLPYAEAILLKPYVARKVSAIEAQTNRLVTINRELNFLQYLKQNQPPYLDAIYLFAKCAPQGARIDSLTMNRRGEVSMRGSMRTSDQVTDFRSKLIASGFFAGVAVEEQAPTPDRQKVNVRMTAIWKPFNERQALAIGPTAKEIEEAKTRKEPPPGAMPPGGMPGGLPPGVMPPGVMPAGISSGALPPRVRVSSAPSGAVPGLPPGVQISLPPGVELPQSFGPGAPIGATTPPGERTNR